MKAILCLQGRILGWRIVFQPRSAAVGMSVVAAFLLGGCATDQRDSVGCGDPQPLAEPSRLELGTIALVGAAKSATVSFDQAQGQIETFGDRAGVAAARVLDPSRVVSDPGAQALVGVGGFVAAPVVAVVGGWSARERLRADQVSESEAELLRQMNQMASQQHFRNALLKAAEEKSRRRLIPVEPTNTVAGSCPEAQTVLETRVQELRLERTGKSDSTYALRIKATARLVRRADGAVLYERPVEYRSGTCLFLDWTLDNSLQKVAETGYREMAERLVERLFVETPQGPLLAGAGYKKSLARQDKALLARRTPDANGGAALRQVSARAGGTVRPPGAQLANYPLASTGFIGVYSAEADSRFTFQKAMTRDEAAVQAVREMEWNFDGLYNHPNLMISLPSIAVAVPIGVWKQGVAVVRGLSERKFKEAESSLAAAARERRPQEDLARQVAQQLAPVTSQRVMLARQPMPPVPEKDEMPAPRVMQASLPGQPLALASAEQGLDTALELRVLSAGLRARNGVNPPMALCIDAEARLVRTRDGQEIYSCPVHFRSQERKFTDWAAKDARLFRQELQRSYRDLGALIIDQLVARRLVAPDLSRYPTLAGK